MAAVFDSKKTVDDQLVGILARTDLRDVPR